VPVPPPPPGAAHADIASAYLQASVARGSARFWFGLLGGLVVLFAGLAAWVYAPGQDHLAAIAVNGDPQWFLNYEVGYEIQDTEILYHNIGHSIANARDADIIFVGWSKVVFGIDWRVFDEFSRKHHVKMFNLAIVGAQSGEIFRLLKDRFGLRPKIWVINADRDVVNDYRYGFFHMSLGGGGPGASQIPRVVKYSWLHAFKDVVGRNLRWRLEMMLGLLHEPHSYRSATTGNWYLDQWKYYTYDKNPKVPLWEQRIVDGKSRITDRSDPSCPAPPEEIAEAKAYQEAMGGTFVLIQLPSVFACAQRIHEIAAALDVPAFTVDPTQFSATDGGGHLDGISARKYTTMLFDWLEQQPEFQRLFAP